MTEIINDYNSFWFILSFSLVAVTICGIVGLVIVKLKNKDNGLFINIFNRHSDEHEDTTGKLASMHDKVIPIRPLIYDTSKEREIHALECNIKRLEKNIKEIKDTVDLLIDRVAAIEDNNPN